LDAGAFLAAIQSTAIKQRLIDETERAWQLGVFGAPTFLVAGERLWGNDRLPMLETIVKQLGTQSRAEHGALPTVA
jgi:2-hydroxychromene-2-carboxylate isomerase